MLQKKFRGLSTLQVSELFADDAHSRADRFFHINWVNREQPHPQFVVITPKKLGLTAVERNRLRRASYIVIRDHFSSWTVGVRIAIVLKKSAVDATPSVFREHLTKLISSLFNG